MPLSISADWEKLDSGTAEERACFAALGIEAGDVWLTSAEDAFVNRVRHKVHLSAYRLAEWLAWNWWRLRWESGSSTRTEWALAHRLSTIGGGYVWPRLTICSDGERVTLISKPTESRPAEPLRYLTETQIEMSATEFTDALDSFIDQVCGQLRAEGVAATNLDRVWSDVRIERTDPQASRRRQLEALLGHDPDEAPTEEIERLIADGQIIGEQAVTELAAAHLGGEPVPTATQLRELANSKGVDSSPRDVVRLRDQNYLALDRNVPAWLPGAQAAKALRAQEGFGVEPLSNLQLSGMAGISTSAFDQATNGNFSFAMDENSTQGRVVLRRTPWQTSRRFEVGRLLGDRLASQSGRFFAATRASTYRQKWQRSFSAELLCPFLALKEMLADDFSDEKLEGAAAHFNVSELTVQTILVNRGLLGRNDSLPAGAQNL